MYDEIPTSGAHRSTFWTGVLISKIDKNTHTKTCVFVNKPRIPTKVVVVVSCPA